MLISLIVEKFKQNTCNYQTHKVKINNINLFIKLNGKIFINLAQVNITKKLLFVVH